eukprot:5987684-Prymnesium_polylepis.1
MRDERQCRVLACSATPTDACHCVLSGRRHGKRPRADRGRAHAVRGATRCPSARRRAGWGGGRVEVATWRVRGDAIGDWRCDGGRVKWARGGLTEGAWRCDWRCDGGRVKWARGGRVEGA